ncbi:protein yellow-like [Schistocerca serialis cubense]|uniref:protein yellow-like n=1 Tax=Schistocerca serialis cubense TaxID=2023355 RepID=UPI00214F217E|nr:protein yellow-like [Schistocerca serialis cubense]
MGSHVCTFALLVLLLVAAGDAHHKSSHATRHGGRVRAAHGIGKASPVARSKGASEELKLETIKATKEIKFDFGDDGTLEKEMKATGRYDPKMVLVYDVTMDSYQRNRIFLTTPLMRRGIPVTLSTIPFDGEEDPKQKPYPNLDIHRTTEDTITDCDNQLVDIVTTVKTWSDDDTLYAIDSGVLDLTTSPKNVCPPKIVSFDLRTDEVINSIVIQNAACNSMYSSLWVDACPDGCLTAYSSDIRAYVLTVTDLTTGASRHLQSQYFHPKPGFFFTKAGGPAYYMSQGLCGVTAGESCDGKLYFQAFASNIQGVVDKHVVHDATDGEVLDIKTQLNLPGELSGTSGEMVVHPNGQLLFFPVLDDVAIYCWNTTKPHDPKNFRMIAQDSERLEYVSSLNIETETERLYVVSDRFTYYLSNTTNYSEENYRILYIDIKDIQC